MCGIVKLMGKLEESDFMIIMQGMKFFFVQKKTHKIHFLKLINFKNFNRNLKKIIKKNFVPLQGLAIKFHNVIHKKHFVPSVLTRTSH